MKRIQVSKFKGVYYRESEKNKIQGKPDRCFDIAYSLPNGKLKWEKVGWLSEGYTAEDAAEIRADRIKAMRHGEELPQKKKEITLSDVWLKYDEWLQTGKKSAETDRFLYHKHLKPRLACKAISGISPFDLERMKMELSKDGYAQATVKHCLVLTQQIINKAILWGLWQGENPVKQVKMPKLNNKRERFLSREEAKNLLKELSSVSLKVHDMALLSLHTGMRAGEIFALKWGHVDLENGLIHIADPKGGEAGKAYITSAVKAMFENRKSAKKKRKKRNSEKRDNEEIHPEAYVFKSRKGGKIREVSDTFIRAVDKLGLNEGVTDSRQKVTFHVLRHTFASWLALQGETLQTIMELMRHKSITMTLRYAHLIPDHKREAVNQLERFIQAEPRRKTGKRKAVC